jgi:hypothetical protein
MDVVKFGWIEDLGLAYFEQKLMTLEGIKSRPNPRFVDKHSSRHNQAKE